MGDHPGVAETFVVSAILAIFRADFANTNAALLLVVVVVAVAAAGQRLAGVLCELSAGAWFDFFLTEPYNQFTINDRADVETTVLLLLVGVAVTELCAWERRQASLASRQAGYLAGIYAAAKAVPTTESSPTALVEKVGAELTTLLGLERCRFDSALAWTIRGCGTTAKSRAATRSGTSTVTACLPTKRSSWSSRRAAAFAGVS